MRLFNTLFLLASIILLAGAATFAQETTNSKEGMVGVWLTEKKGGKIEMFRCGDTYCGKTVWISTASNPAGMDARDPKNPDPKKRDRKLVGTTIFWNLKWNPSKKEWRGGYVYDPTRGDVFRCKAWLENGGKNLRIRGFLGISLLGSTTTWTRVK